LVYFIGDKNNNIKIGYTERSIKKRIKELATGNSSALLLLGYISNGDLELEKQLHKQFNQKFLEWYFPTAELLEYINSNNDMSVYVDWLNENLITYKRMKEVTLDSTEKR
jgi:hypothetical protein